MLPPAELRKARMAAPTAIAATFKDLRATTLPVERAV
jgi:hypothetical protein